jgi:hypothetical protein
VTQDPVPSETKPTGERRGVTFMDDVPEVDEKAPDKEEKGASKPEGDVEKSKPKKHSDEIGSDKERLKLQGFLLHFKDFCSEGFVWKDERLWKTFQQFIAPKTNTFSSNSAIVRIWEFRLFPSF